jgi:hypothetical protein
VARRNLKVRSGSLGPAPEVSTIPKQVDLRVHDREALDEIELVTDVLGAVAASEGPLSSSELDQVLGIKPAVCTHSALLRWPVAAGRGVHDVGRPAAESKGLVHPDGRMVIFVNVQHDLAQVS